MNKKALQKTLEEYANYPMKQQRIELPSKQYKRQELESIVHRWYTSNLVPEVIQSGALDLEEIIDENTCDNSEWSEVKNIDNLEIVRCVNLWFWFYWIPEHNAPLIVDHENTVLNDFNKYLLYQYFLYSA